MKFLVVSDTHGKIDKVTKIYKNIGDIDTVIHLGDYERDAHEIETVLGCDVISVRGNMDGGYTKSEFKIISTEAGNMLLTHGHMQNVKSSIQPLMYFAEENNCNIVLFGHTHRAISSEISGLHIINPGSLTLPADGSKGTCALLEITDSGIKSEIIEWTSELAEGEIKSPETPKQKPKVKGGYIRDLLNNSDRF